MTNFTVNQEKATLAIPVTLKARLTVERAMVKRQYRGEQIGSINTVVLPTDTRTLYDKMVQGANLFVRHYTSKGYQPLSDPQSFIVWGPYKHKPTSKPGQTMGWQEDEDPFEDAADFVIEGQFLATRGKWALADDGK